MGRKIDTEAFADDATARFGDRLSEDLVALRLLLEQPTFGEAAPSLGAELELNLVDEHGRPYLENARVCESSNDPRVVLETGRFNLEINSRPVSSRGNPFSALGADLDEVLARVRAAAAEHGARILTIGILPTIRPNDLVLTDSTRARALSRGIRRARQRPTRILVEGVDQLVLESDGLAPQGAATSFQLHLRVPPRSFAPIYNATQIATAVALAVSVNSPTFVGRRLWDETRIPVFEQAFDDRAEVPAWDNGKTARVSFGTGWVRGGVTELFEDAVASFHPLLPILGAEDPLRCVRSGRLPRLDELTLHGGTVWRWNRPVYDPALGGHLRIEMRALPAGPTMIDMMANAALLCGLAVGLAPETHALTDRLAFEEARHNFYEAARYGMNAKLLWPSDGAPSPRPTPIGELVRRLLPTARRGLAELGVDDREIARLLGVIAARVARGVTGASWQAAVIHRLGDSERSLDRMLARYAELSVEGRPLHEWPEHA